jgi:hypothetical protein
MSAITDAQTVAIYDGENKALPASIQQSEGTPEVVTATSTTPFQISTQRAAFLYIAIATAAALTITMGPEAAGTSVPVAASAVEAIGVTTLRVPAGWYVVLTGTVADFVLNAVLV